MATQLCAITGVLRERDGMALANQELTISYESGVVAGIEIVLFPPDELVVSDADGNVAFELYSGNYIGKYLRVSAEKREFIEFKIAVPEAPTANLEDLIDQNVVVTSDIVTQAQQARDDAATSEQNAANSASSAASSSAAVGVASGRLIVPTYAEFATIPVYSSPSSGQVVVAVGDVVMTADGKYAFTVADPASNTADEDYTGTGGVKLKHPLGPIFVGITGQSNAAGLNFSGAVAGPNPAAPQVKVWDNVAGAWGSSDYTQLPLSRSNPDGNGGWNNFALARAHRIAEETGRPARVVFYCDGATAIEGDGGSNTGWVGNGTSSTVYAGFKAAVEAALAATDRTELDELIFAQGESNEDTELRTYFGYLETLFRQQFQAESWAPREKTTVYIMSPTYVFETQPFYLALQQYCYDFDNRCIFVRMRGAAVPRWDNGTLAPGEIHLTNSPGQGNHWDGDGLWAGGYHHIADASQAQTPQLFVGRLGIQPAPTDTSAYALFSAIVSSGSWDFTDYQGAPLALHSISWGENVSAAARSQAFGLDVTVDGVQSLGAGNNVNIDAAADWSAGIGRNLDINQTYSAAFGLNNTTNNTSAFAAGQGHTIGQDGGAALGLFSEYDGTSDDFVFQVGNGTGTGGNANTAFGVRQSGAIVIDEATATPSTLSGKAQLFVDAADGDLKVRFGDGTVKTIVVDT